MSFASNIRHPIHHEQPDWMKTHDDAADPYYSEAPPSSATAAPPSSPPSPMPLQPPQAVGMQWSPLMIIVLSGIGIWVITQVLRR